MKRKNPIEVEPILVSVKKAEALTDVSDWKWRRLAYEGKIASVKIGTRLLIPMDSIIRFINEATRAKK
jgi:hypothetical protein